MPSAYAAATDRLHYSVAQCPAGWLALLAGPAGLRRISLKPERQQALDALGPAITHAILDAAASANPQYGDGNAAGNGNAHAGNAHAYTAADNVHTHAAASNTDAGNANADNAAAAILANARRRLDAYFDGSLDALSHIATDTAGAPPFFSAAWNACRSIPAGETRSYQWLAHAAGSPRAVRAAGQAMAQNPLPLVIPCHRVIGSGGGLHGYGGGGIAVKSQLLALERHFAAGPANPDNLTPPVLSWNADPANLTPAAAHPPPLPPP